MLITYQEFPCELLIITCIDIFPEEIICIISLDIVEYSRIIVKP